MIIIMQQKMIQISTRDFLRDFTEVVQRPKAQQYTILRHGQPVGVFTPTLKKTTKKKRVSIDDLIAAGFTTRNPRLSQEIDEIIYGTNK